MKRQYFTLMVLTTSVLLFVFISLPACRKKTNQIEFSGKVINPGTGQPVSDAVVSLASTSVQSWVYNSNFQDIASMNSASDGTFSFKFNEQAANAYRIYIYKTNYFTNTTIVNASDVSSEAGYEADFELIPEATIVLNVKNTSPQDSSDRNLFKILTNTVACSACCPVGFLEGKGTNYDTTITCKTYGNFNFVVESNITKGANTVIRKDSVYMTPFQSMELNIFY